ncbi:MAG: aminoacyl--tRNA ligase-related protein [Candidatus Nealsonbacteria bacterium]
MLQSEIFTKILREAPKDETSINAQLLIRAGFIDKLMAGVYSYLPLGLRVFKKIENIIREEMNNIGAQELFLPVLHPKVLWEKTGRWQYEEMFKLTNREKKEFSLGWTHEEIVTPLVKSFVNSYKDLPVYVYQIQDKFRDELRSKSGLLRGREFIMKDLYSFHATEEDLNEYYEKVKKAYFKIFQRCGLQKQTFLTVASGGSFSKYSHEFQTITTAGEDEIYLCLKCNLGINKEIIQAEKNQCPECGNKELEIRQSIEVGNIFKLKDKYTQIFDFKFKDKDGQEKIIMMGCYGIGLGRLMGTIVEIYHDNAGMIWPEAVAPFQIHLIRIEDNPEVNKAAEKLYSDLQKQGIEVLYDDRKNKTPGEKFAEADLLGVPQRIVISERTIKVDSVELKKRAEESVKLIKISKIKDYVK